MITNSENHGKNRNEQGIILASRVPEPTIAAASKSPRTMKRSLLIAAIAASSLSLGEFAAAQNTVATDPVGFTSSTVAAGRTGALSLPLDNMPAFVGPVSNRTSNTIQTANAGWTAGDFGPFTSKPHVIRVLSGAAQGRQFRISSNTTDTLTLTTGSTDLTTALANGDRYEILPVDTLSSLFGQNAAGLVTGTDPNTADNVLIRGSAGWLTYYNDGTNWLRQGAGSTPQNNVPILPETGALLVNRGTSAFSFTLTGAVPTTKLKTDLPANRLTILGNRFPVGTTLVALGLHTSAGWNSNADPALADKVLFRGANGWLTFYHDGANWLRQGAGSTPQNPAIAVGTAVLVDRRAGTDVTLEQQLPYNL